jgi:eukaryotic-like serine/threonine-protein kinase
VGRLEDSDTVDLGVEQTISDGGAGQAAAPIVSAEADLAVDARVGEYVIESVLGRGGFGTVYRAVQPVIGKRVAIKVLSRKFSADSEMVSRFAAEARAVNQIRHRHIIDIFAFGRLSDGRQYYVMEYLDGEGLDQYLATNGPLSLEVALPILRAIARALDAAHAKGVAHRDLKPENVYLARDDDGGPFPKLLDFGIAKLSGQEEQLAHKTNTGVPIGTPYYMSPEQTRGVGVDHRTDLYSFGALAYRLLTGTYPFDGSLIDILHKQVHDEPPPPSTRNPKLPPHVDAAIAWMMRKDPAERPASVSAAVAALQDTTLQSSTSLAAALPNSIGTSTAARARRGWLAPVAALVLIAGGVVVFVIARSGEPEPVKQPAQEPRVLAEPPAPDAAAAIVPDAAELTNRHRARTGAARARRRQDRADVSRRRLRVAVEDRRARRQPGDQARPQEEASGTPGTERRRAGCRRRDPRVREGQESVKQLIVIAVVAACGETAIDRDVCGNGIVEAGEDCDSTDGRCTACAITCSTTAECLAYDDSGGTAGFVCGPDALCHAPSGTFERAAEVSLPLTSLRVTDANHDGFGDVLAQASTKITVLFSDATASVGATTAETQTPFPQGLAAYADLDGDNSLDALLPTPDGIVAYTTPFGVPASFPFPSFVGVDIGAPLFSQAVTETVLGSIGTPPGSTALAYVVLDTRTAPPTPVGSKTDLCGGQATDFSTDEVEVFTLPGAPGHQVIAMRLRPPQAAARLCVIAVDFNGGTQQFDIQTVAVPAISPESRPVLANLRNQACPSLVVARSPAGIVELTPKPTTPCSFNPPAQVVLPPGIAEAKPVGAVELTPPLAPNTAPNALALDTGIYAVPPAGPLVELHRSARPLAAARSVDLDGDGNNDIVATGPRTNDIDLLYRIPGAPAPGFTAVQLATESPVVTFVLGDYDGNRIPDIAYVERRVVDERLVIAYGTADRPLPGVVVGSFRRVLSVIRTNLPDSSDPFNLISDLAVLFENNLGAQLALLHGSPQRTLLAFFDPRLQPLLAPSVFRGVVVGRFGGERGNDVLGIEQTTINAVPATNLWLSIGAMGGELSANQFAVAGNEIQRCPPVPLPTQPFCIDDARYLAFPAGDRDLVLGFDTALGVIQIDPSTFQQGQPAAPLRFADRLKAPEFTQVTNAFAITLEDATHRLVVSLGPTRDAPMPRVAAAVNLCTVSATTGPACIDVATEIAKHVPEVVACADAGYAHVAAASRFAPPDSPLADLVVLCHRLAGDVVVRVSADFTVVEPLLVLVGADALQLGDVNGDAIDDLVVIDRNFAVPLVRVFRQCTSRDVGCGLPVATGVK